MMLNTFLIVATAVAPALASISVPSLRVPSCPATAIVRYDKSVPDQTEFPLTEVDLCYDDSSIHLTFTAYNETNFYFNSTYGTNDNIWEYEVMEAFIYHGTNDPQTYLEFEVSPNNVTFNAIIYNPSKVRKEGAFFNGFFITDPVAAGLTAETKLNRPCKTWTSSVRIPLGLFNVDDGQAHGTRWRMNFLRTVTSPSMFPDQLLGAWSPPDQPNFHMTPFFGNIEFV